MVTTSNKILVCRVKKTGSTTATKILESTSLILSLGIYILSSCYVASTLPSAEYTKSNAVLALKEIKAWQEEINM